MELTGREVVLGVTGGIAAYKSTELVSRLRKMGAHVHVIMTEHATQFITPQTMQTLSANPVAVDLFQSPEPWRVEHIALAQLAELFVVAPATANILAKMATGLADDMLSTTLLATKAPILVAPAMNTGMWTAEATRENVRLLRQRGVHFIGPDSGTLACGDTGAGRMSEPEEIAAEIVRLLSRKKDLEGVRTLVTAGATREWLDPVRFMTNESSGKMGFALAEAARDRGAEVTLVCGHVTQPLPDGVQTVRVDSTQDLYDAMLRLAPEQQIIIQAAAPADYRFSETFDQKFKKDHGAEIRLTLVENPDVARAVGAMRKPGQTLVGFAAETEHGEQNARGKMEKKHLDLIVLNDVTREGAGFNTDTNIATLFWQGGQEDQPLQSKRDLAERILDRVLAIRKEKGHG